MKNTLGKLRTKIHLFYFICTFFPLWMLAQRPTPQGSVSPYPKTSSTSKTSIDTLGKDSLRVDITRNINLSKDALDEPVDYEAKDSIIFDNKNNLVHLYREAVVKFQTIEVKAAYIVLNIKENLALAEPLKEKNGQTYGIPDFKDRDQTFKANKMRYNFKTKKGIVYDVQTQQQSLYVIGEKTKFVSRDATPDTSDTDIIYTKDAILTTCNDPHPHYGIRAQKLKVLANKLVIVGPSNLEIGGVPTPLWLPFGFYPVTKNKQTGLLFPTAYGFQAQQGLGVQGLGWYFPLGKHYNLQMRGDYYTRGNWGIKSDIDYRYRYRFSGSGSLSYNTIATEVLGELEKSKTKVFSLSWNHTQDPAARPNQSFNANVRISTNAGSVQRNLSYDYRSATRNSLNSGINFSRQFPGKPFSFSTGFTHDQNTLDHKMNLGYTANFPTQAMFPFRSVKSSTLPEGVNNFLDQFSINYNANAEARLNTIDSLLLDKATLSKVRTGIKHSASASAPVKVLKYITVSPNANFGQTFFFDQIKKQYKDVVLTRQEKDKVTGELIDVPYQIGKIDTIRQSSLTPVNNFDMGVSFNTTLFGTMQLKKGFFRGVRHKMNISGNFSYVPVLIKQTWFDSVQQVRAWSTTYQKPVYQRYSIFEGGINSVSDPGLNPRASKRVSFNIGNTLEAKIKNRKDTIARRIRLLDNFTIPISFDLSRDSMKMDGVIPMSINNNFFKGLINVNLSWGVTPYERYKTTSGQWKYINQKVWEIQSLAKIGKLNIPKPFNLEGGTINVSTGFTVRQMIDYFVKKDTAKTKIELKPSNQNANAKQSVVSELPGITTLIDNFSIRYSYAMNFNRNTFSGKDTLYVSAHQIGISGSIPLSKNWNLNIGNIGFNLGKSNPPPYIDIGISRDLHCWELAGSWQPTRQSFFFTLRVKQAPLDFLKLPIQKGNQSSFGRF